MFRRNSDYLRLGIGILLLAAGAFTYFFPEISYQKAKGSGLFAGVKQFEQVTIVVPEYVSGPLAALGFIITISTLRYARRSR